MSHIESTALRAIGDAENALDRVERELLAGEDIRVSWGLYRYTCGFAVGVYETALEFPLIARSEVMLDVKKRLDVMFERAKTLEAYDYRGVSFRPDPRFGHVLTKMGKGFQDRIYADVRSILRLIIERNGDFMSLTRGASSSWDAIHEEISDLIEVIERRAKRFGS